MPTPIAPYKPRKPTSTGGKVTPIAPYKAGGKEQAKGKKLQAQVGRQERKIEALGGKVKKGGPSVISRVFDVLSRGQYASAEAVRRISKPGGFVKGFASGLAGKSKTSYGQILREAGVKGPAAGILGFVGDVALDPTTYLGAGVVKAAGKGAAKTAGMRATAKVLGEKGALQTVEEAGKKAAVQALEKQVVKGGKALSAKKIARVTKAAENAKRVELGSEAYKLAHAASIAEKPGALTLRFAGKELIKSEKAYKGLANLGKIVGDTSVGKSLTKAFRTSSQFPELTNVIKRRVEQAGIKHFEIGAKNIDNLFKDLTKAEKRSISHAIERGNINLPAALKATVGAGGKTVSKALDDVTREALRKEHGKLANEVASGKVISDAEIGRRVTRMKEIKRTLKEGAEEVIEELPYKSELHGVMAESGRDLGEYVDEARRLFDEMFDDEAAKDVFRDKILKEKGKKSSKKAEDFKLDNYVHHFYKGGSKEERNAVKNLRRKAVGPETPGFTQKRVLPTLDDAKAKGLKPVEEIDDILKLRVAKHHSALARRNFVHGVAEEYGTKLKTAAERRVAHNQGLRTVDSPYLDKDVYLPERIAKSLEVVEKLHADDEAAGMLLGMFDKIQNHWKFFATAANPGHHIRNLVGDIWNNFLDGVTNPARYAKASALMSTKNPEAISTKIGGVVINGEELLRHNINSGAAPGFTQIELGGQITGKLRSKVIKASEKREEWGRLAHFVDAFMDEGKGIKAGMSKEATDKALKEAADRAAQRVRKWNIDYSDLTPFEREVMKRAMPFYTWTRKNIPLQLEALAMRPGRMAVAPKGMRAIETILGTDTSESSGIGGPDIVPKWIKEMASVRLQGEGEGKNAKYWIPALPAQDISKFVEGGKEGILQSILSQISPAARIPIEQATGEKLFSGAPVGGTTQYATEQIPMARTAYRAAKGKMTAEQWINYLTGAGVHEIGPAQKASELRRQQQPLKSQVRVLKEKRKRERKERG